MCGEAIGRKSGKTPASFEDVLDLNDLVRYPFFIFVYFQVSWIRKSDAYILSVDSAVFISDKRFKVLRPQPGTEWNLHIKSVAKSDEGLYECQISTEPKMSYYTHLNVVGMFVYLVVCGPNEGGWHWCVGLAWQTL